MSGGSSVVEHFLAKERVAGSNPVRRSRKAICMHAGGFSIYEKTKNDDRMAVVFLLMFRRQQLVHP